MSSGTCVLGCIRHGITSWAIQTIVLLCSALEWPPLEYCVQFWTPQYNSTRLLESVQKRAMMMVKGLEGKPNEECLRVQPGEGDTEGRTPHGLELLMRRGGGAGSDLSPLVTSGRT